MKRTLYLMCICLGIALGACGPDEEKVVIDIPGDNGVADGDNGTPGEDGDKGTPGEDGDKGTPGEDGDPVAEISCGGKLERVLKDGSGISVTMESKRVGDVCEVWAVQTVNVKKEKTRGFPLDKLHDTEEQTLSTCEAIGFGKDVELGSCPFGSQGYDYSSEQNFGKCGFPVSEYYRFGNKSTSNGSSNSPLTQYTLQSSMMRSNVITDFDGDIRTQCSIRTEGPDIVPCGEEAQTVETYTREDRGEEPKLHISMKTQIHVNDDGTVDDTVCDIWALQSYDPEEEEFEAPAPLGNLNAVKSPTMSTCEALGLGEDVELGSCKIRFDSNGRVTEDCGYGMKGDSGATVYGNARSGKFSDKWFRQIFDADNIDAEGGFIEVLTTVSTKKVRTKCRLPEDSDIICGRSATLVEEEMVDGSEFPFSMVTKKSEDDDTVCEIWHLRSRKDGEKGYPLRRLATHDNSVDSTCAALGFREDVSVGTCHYDRYDGADCGYADADYYIYAGEFAKAASLTDGPLWRYVNKGRSSSSSAISSVDGTTKTLCRM